MEDKEAWRATVHGVAESWTQLRKRTTWLVRPALLVLKWRYLRKHREAEKSPRRLGVNHGRGYHGNENGEEWEVTRCVNFPFLSILISMISSPMIYF